MREEFQVQNFNYIYNKEATITINGEDHVFTFDESEDGEGSGLMNITITDSEEGDYTIYDVYNKFDLEADKSDKIENDIKDQIIGEIKGHFEE